MALGLDSPLEGGMEEHLTLASHYLFVSRLAAHSKKLSRIVGDRRHDNFFHFDGDTGSDLSSANPPPLPRGIFLALLHLISLTHTELDPSLQFSILLLARTVFTRYQYHVKSSSGKILISTSVP